MSNGWAHRGVNLPAAAKLGVAPRDCIVFEDAVNGIEAAIDAKMRVVAFTGTNTHKTLEDAGPDKIVGSFDELAPEIGFR